MSAEPIPAQIDSWATAEHNAAAWMRHWGYADAHCTPPGRDGGIDIRAIGALAQVKFEAAQVGAPAVQRLVGARGREYETELLFFSGAGFAGPAVAYADTMDVALFRYDLLGRMAAQNQSARDLLARSATSAPHLVTPTGKATPIPAVRREGRGWLRRNWTLLLGLFFAAQALVNGAGVIAGTAESGIDWYDPAISLLVGAILLTVWRQSSEKRRRWKAERERSILTTRQTSTTPRPIARATLSPYDVPHVIELVAAGRKIHAIKVYRAATGLGLPEAKAAVDAVGP